MSRIFNHRPSPAMAVALIALFVALGGTGYAAVKLNGKNIKDNSIPGTKSFCSRATGCRTRARTRKCLLAYAPSARTRAPGPSRPARGKVRWGIGGRATARDARRR